jgi:RNA polymerase sigma-70 factor (ECF subfamily)
VTGDEELLAAALAGDGEAFAAFYRRHVADVTAYLRRRVSSAELAFDLTAETFAAAAAGLDGFRPERGSARGWLFGIAANELRQAWRRGKVESRARRRLAMEPIVLDDAALQRVEELAASADVARAFAALPAAEREAIEGRVVDERSYADIAGELRCSEAVVRQRVSRGLRRMRGLMEERA